MSFIQLKQVKINPFKFQNQKNICSYMLYLPFTEHKPLIDTHIAKEVHSELAKY